MNTDGMICPLCGGPLLQIGTALRCPGGHSFDLAKEGYAHLLPVQKKRTKDPGDSREMVDARARFLQAGHYGAFAARLADLCCAAARAQEKPLHILDMGCGEGYYSRAVAQRLADEGLAFELIGMDISKAAVRRAAKLAPAGCSYAVASSFAAPVAAGWADVVLNVFAPFAREEFLRVLRPGGQLIYAVPGPRHLFGLKEVLYETPYENPVQQVEYPGLAPAGEADVDGQIRVEGEAVQDLFAMTPYFWKTPREGAQRLAECSAVETPIQFRFLQFTKE